MYVWVYDRVSGSTANNLMSVGRSGTPGFGQPDVRMGCQLTFLCKHFSSVHGCKNLTSVWTSGEHPMDVRFWMSGHNPQVWSESDFSNTALMSPGHPRDVGKSYLGQNLSYPSLVRSWHLKDITDVPRTSREHQAITSKFGQNLMFARYFWRPQDI